MKHLNKPRKNLQKTMKHVKTYEIMGTERTVTHNQNMEGARGVRYPMYCFFFTWLVLA